MKFKLYIIISLMLSLVGYGNSTQREQLMDMIYSTPSQTPIKQICNDIHIQKPVKGIRKFFINRRVKIKLIFNPFVLFSEEDEDTELKTEIEYFNFSISWSF